MWPESNESVLRFVDVGRVPPSAIDSSVAHAPVESLDLDWSLRTSSSTRSTTGEGFP